MIPVDVVGQIVLIVGISSCVSSFALYCVLDRLRFVWRRKARRYLIKYLLR